MSKDELAQVAIDYAYYQASLPSSRRKATP